MLLLNLIKDLMGTIWIWHMQALPVKATTKTKPTPSPIVYRHMEMECQMVAFPHLITIKLLVIATMVPRFLIMVAAWKD